MTSFSVRCRRGAVHDKVQFFVGTPEGSRALAGEVTLRRDETAALWRWLGGTTPVGGGDPEPIEVEVAHG